jgi:hypothetical protein
VTTKVSSTGSGVGCGGVGVGEEGRIDWGHTQHITLVSLAQTLILRVLVMASEGRRQKGINIQHTQGIQLCASLSLYGCMQGTCYASGQNSKIPP